MQRLKDLNERAREQYLEVGCRCVLGAIESNQHLPLVA